MTANSHFSNAVLNKNMNIMYCWQFINVALFKTEVTKCFTGRKNDKWGDR